MFSKDKTKYFVIFLSLYFYTFVEYFIFKIMKKIFIIVFFFTLQQALFAQFKNVYKSEKILKSGYSEKASKQSALMDKYDVKFYKLDINAERNTVYISGNVTINAIVKTNLLDTFAFELKDYLTIDSIYINNQKRIFSRTGDDVFVGISALAINSSISAQIFYKGMAPNTGAFFSGISSQTSQTWGNRATWTLSESFAAKQWFPVKQSLTDKIDSVYIFVTTSNDNKVGSNGILTNIVNLPNNKVRYEWKTRYPIVYYLISIAVAKYVEYNIYAHPVGLQDSVLIQNYVYDNPQALPTYLNDINRTKDFLELYSDLFGMYPFYKEKYGHSLVPLGGGMEHQTMTTLGDFNFYLNCHELSHQWWGDNVTCATWSDIWINEGFASYAEYLAADALISHQEAQQHMSDFHDYILQEPDGSVFIPPYLAIDENRIFDGRLSYKKGAAIIHNLRFEIDNDTVFYKILKQTQIRFKDSTITGMEFKAIAEEISGKNFSDFFNQWYFGEGYPYFNISYWQQNDSLYINVNQFTSTSVTPLFKMNFELKVNFNGSDTIAKFYQQTNMQTFKIPMNKLVTGIVFDPNNWIINGLVNINRIDEYKATNFLIYPNPCSDKLQIYLGSNKSGNYQIRITNISGKEILIKDWDADNFSEINISNLEKGIYFLQISDGLNKTVQKFIKQ